MKISWKLIKEAIGWGIVLWFIGYVLGIFLFMVVPGNLIGWVIMPIGVLVTYWVLIKKIKGDSLQYYLVLGITWAVIAILCDYFLLVKIFKPADGYYKLDVYLYYLVTLLFPIMVGLKRNKKLLTGIH
jgi:hypothetical protein